MGCLAPAFEISVLQWLRESIATAYDLATDPTLPDLAREPVDSWVDPTVELRLLQARALLRAAFDRLLADVGDALVEAREALDESG